MGAMGGPITHPFLVLFLVCSIAHSISPGSVHADVTDEKPPLFGATLLPEHATQVGLLGVHYGVHNRIQVGTSFLQDVLGSPNVSLMGLLVNEERWKLAAQFLPSYQPKGLWARDYYFSTFPIYFHLLTSVSPGNRIHLTTGYFAWLSDASHDQLGDIAKYSLHNTVPFMLTFEHVFPRRGNAFLGSVGFSDGRFYVYGLGDRFDRGGRRVNWIERGPPDQLIISPGYLWSWKHFNLHVFVLGFIDVDDPDRRGTTPVPGLDFYWVFRR